MRKELEDGGRGESIVELLFIHVGKLLAFRVRSGLPSYSL